MKKLILLLATASLFTACDSDSKGKDKYDREKSSAEGREKDDYRSSDNKANSDNPKTSDNADNNNLDTRTGTDEPNNSGTVAGWPQIERNGFINSCEKRAIAEGSDRLTAQSYCQCMLDKMEDRYPDINVVAKLTRSELTQFTIQNKADCLEEH